MKKTMIFMMLFASITVLQCCTSDSADETTEVWDDAATEYGQTSSTLDDNQVSVIWSGTTATVSVADNISAQVIATIKGGHVCIIATSDLQQEVTYTLSGTATDGSLYMDGDYKATFVLNELSLTSNRTDSAAINIRNGKRIAIVISDGTTNTLTDKSGGSQKGCFMVNGHTEFEGGGTLNIAGKSSNAFWGDEYVKLKSGTGTINIKSAVDDGINVNQYFQMKGGTINISGVGDDGIAVAATDDTTDEYNGQMMLEDGTATISVTGSKGKALKSEGALTISGGTYTLSSTSNEAIESESTIDISGGVVYATAKDDAINSASHMTISGGYVMGYSPGNDGLDANGNMYIKGGTVYAICAGQPEVALDANTESGYKLYVQGGTVVAVGGLESGASLSQSCYATSSWSRNTWYALYNGSTLALAFKAPGSGGSGMVVSTSSTPSLKSGVSVSSGTALFDGMGYSSDATLSGGTSVTLSSYSGGNGMGGGMGPGGRW